MDQSYVIAKAATCFVLGVLFIGWAAWHVRHVERFGEFLICCASMLFGMALIAFGTHWAFTALTETADASSGTGVSAPCYSRTEDIGIGAVVNQ